MKVKSAEFPFAKKVKLSFKQRCKFLICRCKDNLSPASEDNFSQIVEKGQRVEIIDVGNWVVDEQNRRCSLQLKILS